MEDRLHNGSHEYDNSNNTHDDLPTCDEPLNIQLRSAIQYNTLREEMGHEEHLKQLLELNDKTALIRWPR